MLADVQRPATWKQVARAHDRFALPAVAGTALTVGTVIAIASQSAPPEVASVALIAVGATGVLSSVLYARRKAQAESTERELSASGARIRAAHDYPLASSPLYYREPPPHSVQYRSADDTPRNAFAPLDEFPQQLRAGDQLWAHWTTSGVGELPVALVGPIAETPYFPPELERFDPFHSLTDEVLVVPPGPAGPAVEALPAAASFDFAPPAAPSLTPLCRSPAADLDPIMLEALSMYPPHLRSALTPVFPPPSPPAPRDPASLCVSCRVVPYEGTVWLPCRDCSGPVCGECVLESFDRDEDGWCSACARGRTPDGRAAAS